MSCSGIFQVCDLPGAMSTFAVDHPDARRPLLLSPPGVRSHSRPSFVKTEIKQTGLILISMTSYGMEPRFVTVIEKLKAARATGSVGTSTDISILSPVTEYDLVPIIGSFA